MPTVILNCRVFEVNVNSSAKNKTFTRVWPKATLLCENTNVVRDFCSCPSVMVVTAFVSSGFKQRSLLTADKKTELFPSLSKQSLNAPLHQLLLRNRDRRGKSSDLQTFFPLKISVISECWYIQLVDLRHLSSDNKPSSLCVLPLSSSSLSL